MLHPQNYVKVQLKPAGMKCEHEHGIMMNLILVTQIIEDEMIIFLGAKPRMVSAQFMGLNLSCL